MRFWCLNAARSLFKNKRNCVGFSNLMFRCQNNFNRCLLNQLRFYMTMITSFYQAIPALVIHVHTSFDCIRPHQFWLYRTIPDFSFTWPYQDHTRFGFTLPYGIQLHTTKIDSAIHDHTRFGYTWPYQIRLYMTIPALAVHDHSGFRTAMPALVLSD